MKRHFDADFNPTFKERFGAIYKLIFYKDITFRFEWNDSKRKKK